MDFKKAILVLLVSLVTVFCYGQTTFQPKPVDINLKGVVYDFESVFEARLHTQGFAISYRKGRLRSYYRTTYQNFEFGYIKDRREVKQTKQILAPRGVDIPRSFAFGKANELFTFRYSLGEKRYLSEKTRRKGVAMGIIYEAGATLGILKPYSLEVLRLDQDNVTRTVETIQYSDETKDDFLDYDNIYGGSSFSKGWDAIVPTLGVHGKLAMHWSLGAFDQKVRAVEAGIMVDIFPRKIPLLVEREDIKNGIYFFKLYVGIQFGDRRRRGE